MPEQSPSPSNNYSTIEEFKPLLLIAGPCAIESKEHCLFMAKNITELTQKYNIDFVFKASYDKANRTAIDSYRGPGIKKGLKILSEVKSKLHVPVISDVHSVEEVDNAAEVLDIIQIPAFLSRQTDLLLAAGKTGKPVNIKKGQFLAPWDMRGVINKIESTGNNRILLTERGTSFGYNNLVADMRSLTILRSFGYPVIFDATHSVQLPGGKGNSSGGESNFVANLARAATAVGVDGLFLEVHDRPEEALSDSSSVISLELLAVLLEQIYLINNLINSFQLKGELNWTW